MDDGGFRATARDTRRQGIVTVAREVFAREGFAETSMSAIASRVGGSKGTLYNYFSSKQDLFAAVIQDECDRKQTALFDSLEARGDDPAAALREFGRIYTRLVLSDDVIQMTRVVIAESARFPELGRIMYEAGPKRGRQRMAGYVADQMRAGGLREADPVRVVEQFCDMCLGVLYRQRLMNVAAAPVEAEIESYVDAALHVILTAYAPAPQAG